MKVPMNVDMRSLRQYSEPWLVSQPHRSVHHSIAGEVESVLCVPLAAFAVVVTAYKYLMPGPFANKLHESIRTLDLVYSDIAKMYQGILGLHYPHDIVVYHFGEALRSLTIRSDLLVLQMGVRE